MIEISLFAVAICLLPTMVIAWISFKWSGNGGEIAYATTRMLVQLLAAGFFLDFLFTGKDYLVGLLVILVMITISGVISVRTVKKNRRTAFWRALAGIAIGGGCVLGFVLYGVLQLHDPAYQPRFIIPIAGMIFSNSMTAVTLAADRFERESSLDIAYPDARNMAWNAALIPQINALLAVGLVSLPGMMTGQILAGVDPLIAVRYQIVVMAMVLQSAGFSVALYLWFCRPQESIIEAR
ncbi:ABC transporter permease [Hyphococcus lacteus]|uniref:ABC transporter permease n=1 Tax=Hyphococcus lacteus TaxID=3143536 RepID=A0ABV3ZAY6_9PROT